MFLSPQYPTFRVKDENETDIKFIEHFLMQEKVWKELLGKSVGIGARRNSISEDKFLNLTFYLPPLPEQQRIVTKIENVKQRIEEIKKLSADQEKEIKLRTAIASSKYKHWFEFIKPDTIKLK